VSEDVLDDGCSSDIPFSWDAWDGNEYGLLWGIDYDLGDDMDPKWFEQIGSIEWASQFDDMWESWPGNLVHQLLIVYLHVCFLFWNPAFIATKHSVIQNAPRRRMGSRYVEVVPTSCQWRTLLGLLQQQCLAFET
jgi:hypothetical protein